jgi:transmembrane sensor
MDDNNLIIETLVRHSLRQKLSRTEMAVVEEWRARSDDHRLLLDKFRDRRWLDEQRRQLHSAPTEEMWADIRNYIEKSGVVVPDTGLLVRREVDWWLTARIAASVLIVVLATWAFWPKKNKDVLPVERGGALSSLPRSYDAAVVFSDGNALLLDTVTVGRGLVLEGGGLLQKLSPNNFSLRPAAGATVAGEAVTERLITGKKGRAVLHFADRSLVTLSHNSSLRYPIQAGRADRSLDLGGEAHFDIAGLPAQPYTIRLPEGAAIQVLGTSFDVRAYAGETDRWVTVINGAVRVNAGSRSVVVGNGQQARVDGRGFEITKLADAAAVLAWERPDEPMRPVEISNADLKSVLRQVASLYGVQIANPYNIRGFAIDGLLSRTETLQNTLSSIELLQRNTVKLECRDDTVRVIPLTAKK